jgi:hypothetical protein
MKLFAAAILLAVAAAAAVNPQLAGVRSVYILPMASGMDQYLAGKLTTRGVVQVMSDPQLADAVLTDHLGQSFEDRMNELYAPAKKEKDSDKSNPFGFNAPPPPVSTFGRGRGAFFLVDRKSRSVLWAVYESPTGMRPNELNHCADRIAQNLATNMAKAGKPKKK